MVELPSTRDEVHDLCIKSIKRGLEFFSTVDHGNMTRLPSPEKSISKRVRISHKMFLEYGGLKDCKPQQGCPELAASGGLVFPGPKDSVHPQKTEGQKNVLIHEPSQPPGPRPHTPWKNYRVISGHMGWVRSIAFDPSNTWFCTGSADRTIKIWDVASGKLKLTLTGHIGQVRGLAVSSKQIYMFSAGDDGQVKCWDLELNKVIRSYHGDQGGGLSCLALHPSIDILLTGGQGSVCQVWDIRTRSRIYSLTGHDGKVSTILAQSRDPQVITGSHDKTIKLWDLRYGNSFTTLTHHKKSVRAMVLHHKENSFASASADNIKKFKLPNGELIDTMHSKQGSTINAMALNDEDVLATGGDNGSLYFWDWKSGQTFQQAQTVVQPGSLDCEAGIYAVAFDITGSRLITCEADKTIKMWKAT